MIFSHSRVFIFVFFFSLSASQKKFVRLTEQNINMPHVALNNCYPLEVAVKNCKVNAVRNMVNLRVNAALPELAMLANIILDQALKNDGRLKEHYLIIWNLLLSQEMKEEGRALTTNETVLNRIKNNPDLTIFYDSLRSERLSILDLEVSLILKGLL